MLVTLTGAPVSGSLKLSTVVELDERPGVAVEDVGDVDAVEGATDAVDGETVAASGVETAGETDGETDADGATEVASGAGAAVEMDGGDDAAIAREDRLLL